MIEQLMNAFADSDLDCHTWSDSALRELAIVATKCFHQISKERVIDESFLSAVIIDEARAAQ